MLLLLIAVLSAAVASKQISWDWQVRSAALAHGPSRAVAPKGAGSADLVFETQAQRPFAQEGLLATRFDVASSVGGGTRWYATSSLTHQLVTPDSASRGPEPQDAVIQ